MSPQEVLKIVKRIVHSIMSDLFKGAPPIESIWSVDWRAHRLPPAATKTLKLSTFQVRQKISRHFLSPSITYLPNANQHGGGTEKIA